jgi:hypothetical protein
MAWGQRLAVRVLAFALRRGADHDQLRHALKKAFPRRRPSERAAMWDKAMARAHPYLLKRDG